MTSFWSESSSSFSVLFVRAVNALARLRFCTDSSEPKLFDTYHSLMSWLNFVSVDTVKPVLDGHSKHDQKLVLRPIIA